MTVKTLLEALLIDWVRRNMRRGERTTPDGRRIRGRVSRDPTTGRWNWWVELWGKQWLFVSDKPMEGWDMGAKGTTLTRLGAHARVRVALRAYEHGTELVR